VEYARIPKCAAFEKLNDPQLEKNCVLSGGDDYELAFTAPGSHRLELESLARELGLPLTRIGSIHGGDTRLTVLDAKGKPLAHRGGFDHFAQP